MKSAALALCLALIAPAAAAGQSAVPLREVRFSGPSAVDELCACLLDLRRSAEAQGRLDFTAEVESAGTGGPLDLTARIWGDPLMRSGASTSPATPGSTTPRSAAP